MAEYSKEFIDKNNWKTNWDFSIHRKFTKLKEGEQVICEGFGVVSIRKQDGKCSSD